MLGVRPAEKELMLGVGFAGTRARPVQRPIIGSNIGVDAAGSGGLGGSVKTPRREQIERKL